MATIPCHCPLTGDGTPRHPDGDTVTLRPVLGFREAAAIRNEIKLNRIAFRLSEGFSPDDDNAPDVPSSDILAILTEGYILHGVESWTLVDSDGEPVPVNRATIRSRILADWELASIMSDEADDAYAEAVMLPLLKTGSTSSPPSPTEASTSPSPPIGMPVPMPSKPSSTITTQTDDTETTISSPAGGSKSSRKASSAA